MAKYIVKPSQNLFDVALHLYGSIEGLFDLLITNDDINMNTDLKVGQELEYHDTFVINKSVVSYINESGNIPANSERNVYPKITSEPLNIVVGISNNIKITSFDAGGEGTMVVDWGDNSALESIVLSHDIQTIEHYFDNDTDKRRIKIYGNFSFTEFDTTNLNGNMILVRPLIVDEYISKANGCMLNGLFLFEGTYKVDLSSCNIADLSPIADMSLQELNLADVSFNSIGVIDDYLEYIVNNYESRRPCVVTLTTEPSERGMNAIQTIISEPSWNTSGQWKFIINDKIYTA